MLQACRHRRAWPGGSIDIHAPAWFFHHAGDRGRASPKNVQEIVGHSSLDLTMNTYARATDSGKRAAINALPFAKASAPDHIVSVSVQNVAKAGSSNANLPQVVSA